MDDKMSLSIDLNGQVILVCGASLGSISGATIELISASGATIVAVDKAQDLLDQTIAGVEAEGGRCHGIVADLLDPAQTDSLAETIWSRFGRLNGVANIPGGSRDEERIPLEQTPTQMFREALNLNLEYVFRVCRDVAASMIQRTCLVRLSMLARSPRLLHRLIWAPMAPPNPVSRP